MNYSYPIDDSWTKEEIAGAIHFFTLIEAAYEKSVDAEALLGVYKMFKQIVPAKSEEKKLFAQFEKDSGYSSFAVIKRAKEIGSGKFKMN